MLDDVTGGYAGAALFYAYLHAATDNDAAADRAFEALERSTSALAERQLLPALYSGFVGVGWVVTHLMREVFEGDPGVAGEIDDALRQLLTNVEEGLTFELIYGLAGYGTYLVERLPDPGAAALLDRVLDLLEESRDASGVWHTDTGLDVAVAAPGDAARLLQPRRRARHPRRDRIPGRRQSRRRPRSASGAFRRRCRAMDAGAEVGSPFRVALSGVHSGRR